MKITLNNNYVRILQLIKIIFLILLLTTIYNISNKKFNIQVCVCTCGKKENKYAREFVEHYKRYKVDKIFIYDNNDENDETFIEVLSDYISSGFVEIINYRGKIMIQMEAFNHCYQKNKNNYDWFIYYDMDEFIHLKNYNNIKKYLSRPYFSKCNIIYLNHILHTDNNQIYYKNGSLFEKFPIIQSFKNVNYSYKQREVLRDVTKVIVRGNISNLKFSNPHILNPKIKNSCNGFGKIITLVDNHLNKSDHNNFYFDHFYFKSSEEFLNKLDVGDVYFRNKRGFHLYWFEIYFAYNKITKEKIDFFENRTGLNLSVFRDKISLKI